MREISSPIVNGYNMRNKPPQKLIVSSVQPTPILPYCDMLNEANHAWAQASAITRIVKTVVLNFLMKRAY